MIHLKTGRYSDNYRLLGNWNVNYLVYKRLPLIFTLS